MTQSLLADTHGGKAEWHRATVVRKMVGVKMDMVTVLFGELSPLLKKHSFFRQSAQVHGHGSLLHASERQREGKNT